MLKWNRDIDTKGLAAFLKNSKKWLICVVIEKEIKNIKRLLLTLNIFNITLLKNYLYLSK